MREEIKKKKKSRYERDLQSQYMTCHCCIWIRSVSVEKVIHMSRSPTMDSQCQGSQFQSMVPCFHFCPSCNQLVKHRQGTITINGQGQGSGTTRVLQDEVAREALIRIGRETLMGAIDEKTGIPGELHYMVGEELDDLILPVRGLFDCF